MEHKIFSSLLFPELTEAITNGYHHCFQIHADGLVVCLSNKQKLYDTHEIVQGFINCPERKATIYLITTNDGLYKGTWVDYWESWS